MSSELNQPWARSWPAALSRSTNPLASRATVSSSDALDSASDSTNTLAPFCWHLTSQPTTEVPIDDIASEAESGLLDRARGDPDAEVPGIVVELALQELQV